MATELRMPDLGTVEGSVTLVRWLKEEGDTVALGEPLFEAETDKGVSEVEAVMPGVLIKRLVAAGEKAGAGQPIALIRRPGEPGEPVTQTPGAPAAPHLTSPARAAAPAVSHAAPPARPPVGPALRALAEKYGVDLSGLAGTGPAGRIVRQDILRARDAALRGAPQRTGVATASTAAAQRRGVTALSSSGATLSAGQAIVAKRVSQSAREKPTYRVTIQADMSAAIAFREKTKASWGAAVSWDSLFVKAVSAVIAEMPLFRRYFAGSELREHATADIAVAVGVGDDLYVPAVRDPLSKSVAVISREITALAERASAHALGSADTEESCFLVSNLGMFPVYSFDAIIYPDHSAALAVGATTPTPVSDGTSIRIAPIAQVSLAVDHRLINGRTAARFMAGLKTVLETGAFT